jgi:hypothetical protein
MNVEKQLVNLDGKPAQGGDTLSKPPIALQYGMAAPRFVVPVWLTICVVVTATAVASFICTYFRTMDWGFHPWRFLVFSLVSLVFFATLVVIASIGRRIRTILTCVAILALGPPVIAESWAGIQEYNFVRRSRLTPGIPMSEARWWFESHGIGTDGKGSYYGYD